MELRLCLRNKELRPEPLQAQLLDSPKRAHLDTSATFPTIHNKKHAVSLDILATREILKLTELTPRGILLEGAGSPKEGTHTNDTIYFAAFCSVRYNQLA